MALAELAMLREYRNARQRVNPLRGQNNVQGAVTGEPYRTFPVPDLSNGKSRKVRKRPEVHSESTARLSPDRGLSGSFREKNQGCLLNR